MTFIVDIDGTLLFSEYENKQYKVIGCNQMEIDLVNKMYKQGHTIILWTGRSWGDYEITIKQLKAFAIKYHQLVMGKPVGIYIDADSLKSVSEYLSGN